MPDWKFLRFTALGGIAALAISCSSYDERFKLIAAPDSKMALNAPQVDAVLRQLAQDGDRPIVLFVHGRGNEPEKSIARNALATLESRHGVRVLMFNWDSFCPTCRPVAEAANAAPDLAYLLHTIAQSRQNGNAGLNKLILLTHSMGSIVVQHAVADGRFDVLPDGMFDAIVLAASGLKRLGLVERVRSAFEPQQMLPAAGQGALGIEVRSDAHALRQRLAELTDRPTWLAVHAERAVSRALGGSCSMPLAAHATWHADVLQVDVMLGHPQQTARPLLRASHAGPAAAEAAAEALGEHAAALLRERGAAEYLRAAAA